MRSLQRGTLYYVASSIDSHPQRSKIIDAIVSGQPYRDIEAWAVPTVTRGSLSRFKTKISAKTRDKIELAKKIIANNDNLTVTSVTDAVTKAAMTLAIDPFTARALKSDARRDRWMEAAETAKEPDYRVLAQLDRNDLTSQEYQARLAGRLDARPAAGDNVALHLHLGIPRLDPTRHPEPIEAQDVTFEPLT